jgi:hypothetical protein
MMTRKTAVLCVGLVATALVANLVAADDQATQQAQTDRLLIQSQRICPVTGKDLRSMGGPVKAEVGKATVFLCCKGCFGQPLNKEHWSKVQANIADAQGLCPIFKKPLGDHPVPVVVNHRLLFVCCKPCTKKVEADPSRSIAFVNEQLAKKFAEPRR